MTHNDTCVARGNKFLQKINGAGQMVKVLKSYCNPNSAIISFFVVLQLVAIKQIYTLTLFLAFSRKRNIKMKKTRREQ